MKGDNDEILCWPWEGNIRIILINQQQSGYERSVSIIFANCQEIKICSYHFRNHITESMDSAHGHDAFKKPETERNMIGFGFQVIDFKQIKLSNNEISNKIVSDICQN